MLNLGHHKIEIEIYMDNQFTSLYVKNQIIYNWRTFNTNII